MQRGVLLLAVDAHDSGAGGSAPDALSFFSPSKRLGHGSAAADSSGASSPSTLALAADAPLALAAGSLILG